MALPNYYASIAIVEIHDSKNVTIESISVTEGECVLSGAWNFATSDKDNIENVLSEKMIIPLGNETKVRDLLADIKVSYVASGSFLKDARKAAHDALEAYEVFKSENPTKRKKLVSPDFYEWPKALDFNKSSDYLESIGKMSIPSGTPEGFKKTLSAARLVKHLIDMWHLDEQERNNRKYVEGDEAKMTMLPESWLDRQTQVQTK